MLGLFVYVAGVLLTVGAMLGVSYILGQQHPDLSGRLERHGDPCGIGQSNKRNQPETSLVDRRLCRFGSFYTDGAQRNGRFRELEG